MWEVRMDFIGVKDIAVYGTDCVCDISLGDDDVCRFISTKEKYFELEENDGTLTVKQKSRNLFYRIILHRIEFKLVLPRNYSGKLRFRNKNGGLYIGGGNYSEVDISTGNGKFKISDAACENFRLKMKNGSVDAKNLKSNGSTVIKCRNGSVKIESISSSELSISSKNAALTAIDVVSKKLECETSNGPIDASGISADDLRLETSNGKIFAVPIGRRDDYRMFIDTAHGVVTVDGTAFKRIADNSSHAPKRISARTENGDVDIRFD